MAGAGPERNLFVISQSEIRGVQDAAKYARERKRELTDLSINVKKMGFLRCFLDSQVSRKNRGWLSVSFNFSDPKMIEEEIKNCLKLLTHMLDAVDKVDDEYKTETEREMPYLIIVNLNAELTDLFETAQMKVATTTSRTVSTMYNEFLDRRPEIEGKLKKMECVFLKQQFLAESRRHENLNANAERASREMISFKEQELSGMKDEVNLVKEENRNLRESIERYERMTEHLMRRLDELEAEKNNESNQDM